MTTDISTTLSCIDLPCCIYNASGPRTSNICNLMKIAKSSSGCILTKSATVESQSGNPLPRTWHNSNDNQSICSLNSEGLPNFGINYYINKENIRYIKGTSDKPYMVSLSGKTLEDNLEMLTKIHTSDSQSMISGIELNLACPNIIGKPIVAYDFEQMKDVLQQVIQHPLLTEPRVTPLLFGIKMPPYLDTSQFKRAASILNKYSRINYVACINTLGNALSIDPISEMPVLKSNDGFAGLSGKAIKYTALANVRKMRFLLKEKIDVVGVGGVTCGQDVFEMILCGATAVQIGTCHWIEGPSCFDRISNELKNIMREKHYTCINDFCGKLKDWNKEEAKLSWEEENKKMNKQMDSDMNDSGKNKRILNRLCVEFILCIVVILLLVDKYS